MSESLKEKQAKERADFEKVDQGYDPYNSATTHWLWTLINGEAQARKSRNDRTRRGVHATSHVEPQRQ